MATYYAVQRGRVPGVYKTWCDAKEQINKFKGAVFKGFDNKEEAEAFAFPIQKKSTDLSHYKMPLTAYVDGSYIEELGKKWCGWGFILLRGDTPIAEACGCGTKDISIRNIGGEIEAAEEAIKLAISLGADYIKICHDYEGVGRWGNNEWNTNRSDTERYREFVAEMRKKADIEFEKVAGHSGDKYNDIADSLAMQGRYEQKPKIRMYEVAVSNSNSTVNGETQSQEEQEIPEILSDDDILEEFEFTTDVANKANTNTEVQEEVSVKENVVLSKKQIPSFKDILKNWRKNEGLSQAVAADLTLVKQFGALERGTSPQKLYPEDLLSLYNTIMPEDISLQEFLLSWVKTATNGTEYAENDKS